MREEFTVALVGEAARAEEGLPPTDGDGPDVTKALRKTMAEDPDALLKRIAKWGRAAAFVRDEGTPVSPWRGMSRVPQALEDRRLQEPARDDHRD